MEKARPLRKRQIVCLKTAFVTFMLGPYHTTRKYFVFFWWWYLDQICTHVETCCILFTVYTVSFNKGVKNKTISAVKPGPHILLLYSQNSHICGFSRVFLYAGVTVYIRFRYKREGQTLKLSFLNYVTYIYIPETPVSLVDLQCHWVDLKS